MSQTAPSTSWAGRVWQAVLVLLAAAAGARLVWVLLEPLLPALGVIAVLLAVISLTVRRRI